MNEDVSPFDLERMFIGDTDLLFILEVAFRTTLIYLFALLLIRLLGKRGQGQLSPFELVIIIALGSAVGDPMFYPSVPIVHSCLVIALVVVFTRGLSILAERNETVEAFVESRPACLVIDGRIAESSMHAENLALDELFMMLREDGIEQLGQVRRAYLEPSGSISVYRFPPDEVQPGLPLYPACDPALYRRPLGEDIQVPEAGLWACHNCGETFRLGADQAFPRCPRCEHARWVPSANAGAA